MEKCKREKGKWVGHTQREWIRDFVPRRKVREVTAQVCAGGDARLGVMGMGGSGSRAQLASDCLAVSLVCVYSVGVTDGGLPLRVMSEVAPIKLGRDEFTSDRPDIMLAAHVFFFFFFFFLSFCGTSNNWPGAATLSDKFVSGGRFRYLRSLSGQCTRRT